MDKKVLAGQRNPFLPELDDDLFWPELEDDLFWPITLPTHFAISNADYC